MKQRPSPTPPPAGAWSHKNGAGPFNPKSHWCSHCKCEIPPGAKLWHKVALVLCSDCLSFLFPSYRN
jgi:hypothetical protein